MSGNGISLDDLKLLADMDMRIGDAGGPTLAFTLIQQRQAIRDRLSFIQWLDDSKALSHLEGESQDKATASQRLSRRAELRLGGM